MLNMNSSLFWSSNVLLVGGRCFWSVVGSSVGRSSVVDGRLVGGFKETSYSYIFSFILQYYVYRNTDNINTQPAITCSKSTVETLEQGVKYVQS